MWHDYYLPNEQIKPEDLKISQTLQNALNMMPFESNLQNDKND